MAAFIIAEAGVNHNGDMTMARKMIDVAAEAGADAVKFQTFQAAKLASVNAPKAAYQKTTTDAGQSQVDMLRGLEIAKQDHQPLIEHCEARGIQFLSTPFDIDSLHFLAGEIGLQTLKLPSGEIVNGPLLMAAARYNCNIVLSTGMSTIDEIRDALRILAFGFLRDDTPREPDLENVYRSEEGQAALKKNVTLLHCNSAYPTPIHDANLRAMETLRSAFGLPIGFSDHTEGITAAVCAATLGAAIIEKHFTLDRSLPGPDHAASLEPHDLKRMIEGIRDAQTALGHSGKAPTPSEMENRLVVRQSLICSTSINEGEVFTERNITTKRPGTGLSPMQYWDILGTVAQRDFLADEEIKLSLIHI